MEMLANRIEESILNFANFHLRLKMSAAEDVGTLSMDFISCKYGECVQISYVNSCQSTMEATAMNYNTSPRGASSTAVGSLGIFRIV